MPHEGYFTASLGSPILEPNLISRCPFENSGLCFCSLQVQFKTLGWLNLALNYSDMGCMEIPLHSAGVRKLFLQKANKETSYNRELFQNVSHYFIFLH